MFFCFAFVKKTVLDSFEHTVASDDVNGTCLMRRNRRNDI